MELLCFSRVLETCGAYHEGKSGSGGKGAAVRPGRKGPPDHVRLHLPSVHGGGRHPGATAQAGSSAGETLFLKFPSIDDPAIRHMKLVFQMFPGKSVVKMVMADTRKVYATQALLHPALVQEAQETLGHENVVVK